MTNEAGSRQQVPTMRDEMAELLRQGLSKQYISESCQDAIETGNHYQSVEIGGAVSEGFRSTRSDLLDRIGFEGKKVLDLGSNLGEMSRGARQRGASLVDGFEYDSYFVEMANLLNAYHGTTRVSFYQRDITDETIYGEEYDIVMALSVFIYARPVMPTLAKIARDAFVLETHRIDGNLESFYLDAVLPHFPAYETLGETEWGNPHDDDVIRSVMVFARDRDTLDAVLRQ
jgi:2-polyprenyl-3-methyl-5-hydroxy-6-metoxy-1,4-benzoquinol methylase